MARLILIDDDPTYHFLAEKLLSHYRHFQNYKCYTDPKAALTDLVDAYYGTEALPDMILLDLNMPEVNGWEFLEMFENMRVLIGKQIPIFIVTSSIDPNDKARALQYPMIKGFYSKPLSPAILNSVINHRVKIKDDWES
ncbi:response regulator [Desertivirga arenae]|uniref:response regulator n=1 Tax=Desertivirga arenae TaxID=2810309 RepID=UPI001A977C7C|nr:response regulator [Pedobacter sp. SYSU D00823]